MKTKTKILATCALAAFLLVPRPAESDITLSSNRTLTVTLSGWSLMGDISRDAYGNYSLNYAAQLAGDISASTTTNIESVVQGTNDFEYSATRFKGRSSSTIKIYRKQIAEYHSTQETNVVALTEGQIEAAIKALAEEQMLKDLGVE